MKLNKLWVAAAAMAMVGCTTPHEEMDINFDDKQTVILNCEIPTVDTRAANSTQGGISNVDWGAYDLRYKVAVYDEAGVNVAYSTVHYDEDAYDGFNESIQLTKGRKYQVYVWADFVTMQGEDLHYNTSDIRTISHKGAYAVNDESRDAYAYYGTIDMTNNSSSTVTAELTRPFAKLRVVTTDANKLSFNQQIGSIKVSYVNDGSTVPASYALADGTLGANTTVASVEAAVLAYANDTVSERTLLTDYIFAPVTGQSAVKVSLEVFDTDGNAIYTIPTIELPLEKNNLTSGKGAVLTGSVTLDITIESDITETIVGL